MPTLNDTANTAAPTTEPRMVVLRCIIKSSPGPFGAAPEVPRHNISMGGVGFAVETYRHVLDSSGERREVPVRGNVQAVQVGGEDCALERMRRAIARKVVRWTHRPKLRGIVVSKRECSRVYEGDRPAEPPRWVEVRARGYSPAPGDIEMADCVQVELVVPGSEHGPLVSLKPGDPLPEIPSNKS